jgi:hypothetical protein
MFGDCVRKKELMYDDLNNGKVVDDVVKALLQVAACISLVLLIFSLKTGRCELCTQDI